MNKFTSLLRLSPNIESLNSPFSYFNSPSAGYKSHCLYSGWPDNSINLLTMTQRKTGNVLPAIAVYKPRALYSFQSNL